MTGIHSTESGKGAPVILIHGFPFNGTIWESFARSLSKDFKVYIPDLPGFGKSELPPGSYSIDSVAALMLEWMESRKIMNAVVVGHSLGGYVSLSMVSKKPDLFSGLVLLHSTAQADSIEKRDNRNKVLDFISNNGVKAFTSNFIEPLFRDKNHPAIATVKAIATQAEENAVTVYTKAMRDRLDRQETLQKFPRNILMITGQHDAGITVESIRKQSEQSPLIRVEILLDSAHMGMFEETGKTLDLIKDFVNLSNRP